MAETAGMAVLDKQWRNNMAMNYEHFERVTKECIGLHHNFEAWSPAPLSEVAEVAECAKKLEEALAKAYPENRKYFWKEWGHLFLE
tara:strand:+ start:58 stop:315 length:258 start_codon:yes stop_codon:yes gene_type:complete